MLQQAIDFRDESEALFDLLDPLDDAKFDTSTRFKGWTINEVLGHLHMWNFAADLALADSEGFKDFLKDLVGNTGTLRDFERTWRQGIEGRELLDAWHELFVKVADNFLDADPRKRVPWAGPDMSVRSSITARLMETWSHGQEVYDILGVERVDEDRIRNIAVLGVNTFGWTYVNRGLEVPAQVPQLSLTAPSGEVWSWNEDVTDNLIEGLASDFCKVVTQVRNIADTSLKVTGDTAIEWMSFAQCFAGGPEDPPAPGTRFVEA